jgi:predicted S18 family serine protease
MNVAHLHLLLTHLPIVGSLAATLILAYALLRFAAATRDLALLTVVLVALTAVAAYATGGGAESAVEHFGVAESAIEPHESAARFALVGSLLTGGIALFSWFMRGDALQKRLLVSLLVLTFFVDAMYARTGLLGGAIRHPEIQTTVTSPAPGNSGEHEDQEGR